MDLKGAFKNVYQECHRSIQRSLAEVSNC